MIDIEALAEMVVPSGKLLLWIVATGTALFFAGVGADQKFGTTAENISTIPQLQLDVASNVTLIEALLDSVSVASEARERILCAVVLAASEGPPRSAPEVLSLCP